MLKFLIILSVNCCLTLSLLCQSIKGKWDGSFAYYYKNTTQLDRINNWPISLDIKLNADSSYTVLTEFKGLDTDEILTNINCVALCKIINSDSVFLQELVITKPKNGDREGLKKMNLKFITRNNHLFMEGSFETFIGSTIYRGEIRFYKKD